MPLLLFFDKLTYSEEVVQIILEKFFLPFGGHHLEVLRQLSRVSESSGQQRANSICKTAHVAGPKTTFKPARATIALKRPPLLRDHIFISPGVTS